MSLPVLVIAAFAILIIYVADQLYGVRLRRRVEAMRAAWQTDFEKSFPAISDAEFLSRCRPGTNPEVALKVRRILSDCLGVEYERIYPESQLVRDLGAE